MSFARRSDSRGTQAIALGAAVLAAALTFTGAFSRWDQAVYDAALHAHHRPAPDDVVIVAIDEPSLAALGRWPWSRHIHADIVDRLVAAEAGAIGFAILFAEPDDDPGADAALARAVARSDRVAMPVLIGPDRTGAAPRRTLPMQQLIEASAALGHVTMEVGSDGVVRETHLQVGVGATRWVSFAEAVLGIAEGGTARTPAAALEGRGADPVGRLVREERVLIPFIGPPGHFTRISALDVLNGAFDLDAISGRIVLVGVTAVGIGTPMATPESGGSTLMPSVEVLANVLSGLGNGRLIIALDGTPSAILAAALAFLPIVVYARAGRAGTGVVAVSAVGLPLFLSVALLALWQVWWPPLGVVVAALLGFVLWSWRGLGAARRAELESRRLAQATLHSIGDAVITTDPAGRIEYMNPVAQSLTGWDAEAGVGRTLEEVVDLRPGKRAEYPDPIESLKTLSGQHPIATREPVSLVSRDGREFGVHANASPLRDGHGRAYGAVIALRDVSDAQRLEREIAHQASHDALTNLPNRTVLLDRLETAVARAGRHGAGVAVLFVDVDRFKLVNDGYGHAFGDKLLAGVADRLARLGRAEDTVARLGGDEFVVVLENLHRQPDVAAVARKLLEGIGRPFLIDGREMYVTGSVGVSVYPKDGASAEELLRNADAAMYRAKDSGRNAIIFFSEELNRQALRRIDLEQRLRRALSRDEFELHFQPLVSLVDGTVNGTEALLRWFEPDLGRINPESFIAVAEDSGLITPIGEWVLDAACRQMKQWDSLGLEPMRISVNVSPRQLLRQDMAQVVRDTLARTHLDPTRLELEITESVMMRETDRYERALNAIQSLGVNIAVDDFGTGYSSLSYLKRYPINRVKIDQSFVQDIGTLGGGAAISRAVIAMARSLDMGVVAEGLENRAQLDYLRERACDEGQGFYLCPPMAAADLARWLSRARTALSSFTAP